MSDCTCEKCQGACQNQPGWFLPGEAERAAEHLGMSLPEFFQQKLGVDWYESTFVLAPALAWMTPGEEYPGDPSGRCIFLVEGRCAIHPVKPHECRMYLHTQSRDETQARHDAVAAAWEAHQQQIRDLLGREPEETLDLIDLFRALS